MDDLLPCANPSFSRYLYASYVDADGVRGIYPDFLQLTLEQSSQERVSFLDTWVAFDGKAWGTSVYDKREHPPLSLVPSLKFPHPDSMISERAKYGIITSQLHRFGRICVRKSDFVERARMFLAEFIGRGYGRERVRRVVRSFLRRHALQFAVVEERRFMAALLRDI